MKFGLLRVTTGDGQTAEHPLNLPSIVVGRAEGSGIIVDDLSISRRHARLTIESGRLLVEDLGSAAGTFIGGHRIPPNTPSLVESGQDLRFGEIHVRYQSPPPVALDEPLEAAEAAETMAATLPQEIRATLVAPPAAIEPGGSPAVMYLTVHNRSRVVDELAIRVLDLPEEWVRMSTPRLVLVPGDQAEITIVVQPPRRSDARAGNYDFAISITSAESEREVIVPGSVSLLPFEGTQLTMRPVRAKRDFLLVAENRGNALVTYGLNGADDENAFRYEFEAPTVTLNPGEEKRLAVKVRPAKRKVLGGRRIHPFRVLATPTAPGGEKASTDGQLMVQGVLQPFVKPLLALLLMAGITTGLIVYFFYWPVWWIPWWGHGGGTAAAGPEARYAGVHMCDKVEPGEKSSGARTEFGSDTGAPLFAQNNPAWGEQEYAKSKDEDFPDWCGQTIEQCGCAMTSVATVMAIFELLAMPDGKELSPQTLNEWLNGGAQRTPSGWVSQGYVYGDVVWTAVNQLSGEIAKSRPGAKTIRFAGVGTGSEEEIRSELRAGRPIVLEVPGHWIAAVKLDGDKIIIHDPYYKDRTTLDAYKGLVKSSVKFEPSADLAGVVITVPREMRVKVTDVRTNKQVGTGSGTTAEEAAKDAVKMDGASFSSREAWRDPTCIESPPPPEAGTVQIILPGKPEDYKIEVLEPNGGATAVAIHSYDRNGNVTVVHQESTGNLIMSMSYDPTRAPQIQTIQGGVGTPGATASGTTTPGGGGGGNIPGGGGTNGQTGGNTPAATTSPGPTTTAKPPTPATPTPTPIKGPDNVIVACSVQYSAAPKTASVNCNGTIDGQYNGTSWTVNGVAAPTGTNKTSLSVSFTQDQKVTVGLQACNVTVCKSASTNAEIKFPTPTPVPTPTTPPAGSPTPTPTPVPVAPTNVELQCSGSQANPSAYISVSCSVLVDGVFTSVTWHSPGSSPSSEVTAVLTWFTQAPPGSSPTVSVSVCNYSTCTSAGPFLVPVTLLEGMP